MQELKINYLQSGGLISNYFCTSRCRHCLYACSPQWDKDYMPQDRAQQAAKIIRKLGCFSVHIGGGEPFLNPEALKSVLKAIYNSGLEIEYIETNSSWFTDEASAVRLLEELSSYGLQRLLISISPFHNEYIPFNKVKGLMSACQSAGISIFPWVESFYSDLNSMDDAIPHSINEYRLRFGDSYLQNIPSRYWIHYGGRSLKTFREQFEEESIGALMERHGPCRELTDTTHFHVDLYGNYIPGLCSGLAIKIEDLNKTLSESDYPILTILHKEGIAGLLKLAQEEYGFKAATHYLSKCHLCYAIREYLVLETNFESHELQPQQHYLSMANYDPE